MTEKAALGRIVGIYYRGGVSGEDPIDVHVEGEPLRVMLGGVNLPRGVEEAIVGMEVGEEKVVDVPFALGYGEYREELARWYPKAVVPGGYGLEVDDVVTYRGEDGIGHPAIVTALTEDSVRLDMNHPFAGNDLVYWLRLESVG